MPFITILFNVQCYNFVSRVPTSRGYYCLIWKIMVSLMRVNLTMVKTPNVQLFNHYIN